MISLDIKQESSSSSPLSLSSKKDEKPTLSFSDLLKGVSKKDDAKVVQNGALVLALDEELPATTKNSKNVKADTLSSLLKGDKVVETKELKDMGTLVELNPKLTQNLTPKELKTLVADAKEYLKQQIINSDGYKDAKIKELPKTLKGLADLAKNFNIDISKITLEQVSAKLAPSIKTPDVKTAESKDAKTELKTELKTEVKTEVKTDTKETIPHAKSEILSDEKPELKTKLTKTSTDANLDLQKHKDKELDAKEQKTVVSKNELKDTPLFKAQSKSEISTEQMVHTKQIKHEPKNTQKDKAQEALNLLLRGEKAASKADLNLTADFSVSTAKVIAPLATTEATKSLESLLRGETKQENNAQSKLDGLNVAKADSFEVKINEAKQMIKYISQDVKSAIEDYKSPFTRVKVQLNPQKLGEVDLTVVQRGKNLHVNISSNNAAINTLAMNANDLRTQLSNNGINNATLNFNNQDSSSQAGQQEQQRQREQNAQNEYKYLDNEELSEEILSSLEIIVPKYV